MIADVRFVQTRTGRWYVVVEGVRLRKTFSTRYEAAGALMDLWRAAQ